MKNKAALTLAALLLVASGCGETQAPGGGVRPRTGRPFGVTFSPVGLPSALTAQTIEAFFRDSEAYGPIVAYHVAWRDSRATSGAVPELAQFAVQNAEAHGYQLGIGFGWANESGPDLTSDADPGDNTWNNLQTRHDFANMALGFAERYKPPYLFLGNETNTHWLATGGSDWSAWISEYEECYFAIKAVSPNTQVFTVFQLEHMAGLGRKNGWADVAHWQLIADFQGIADAIGFTTYPYFEYETPAALPADYYMQIARYWTGPVYFTELGWIADPALPYTGSPTEQAEFVTRFFDLTSAVDMRYATYLFLNDPTTLPPAFRQIGLRDTAGAPRPADAVWRASIAP